MSYKINTKIQPLIEDLKRIIPGAFLTSTEYKRWLVERGLDEVWSQCISYVAQRRSLKMTSWQSPNSSRKNRINNKNLSIS